MVKKLRSFIFLICFTTVLSKDPEPELPPCPTNFQMLPQNLPMHCKMVSNPAYPNQPPAPPLPVIPPFPPYFPGPIVGKQPENNPAAPVPGTPAVPAPAFPPPPMPAMPVGMGQPMPMGIPPMPMGMPMFGSPPSKLPVIVMPFYSPDPSYKNSKAPAQGSPHRRPKPYKRKIRVVKKSRHRHSDDDSDTDTDTDSSETDTDDSSDRDRSDWNWKHRRAMSRRKKMRHIKKKGDYLTPILQYVSKDGYVIFEKQISKGEAKDWLGNKEPAQETNKVEEQKPSQIEDKDNRTEEADEPKPVARMTQTNKPMRAVPDLKVAKYNKIVPRKHRKAGQQMQAPKKKRQQ